MGSIYTVLQVNNYIKNMIRQDFLLGGLQVTGEVSNCKYHHSGHVYFTLKDEKAAISCVMFAGNRAGLAFSMRDGDKVVVSGSVEVYEKAGTYQLYARRITAAGAGLLYERFLALKQELEEMGMFAPEYKKPIPAHAKTIGVVTAPTGAAIRDIQNIIRRRNPGVRIILYPARVQGEGAKESIVKGLQVLDAAGVDVIIAGRGGGSIEDLWAFNEESVARAIFACETPVISAVGHETDVTIADYVADLRAPTPSAAAELAAENIFDTIERLRAAEHRLDIGMRRAVTMERMKARQYAQRLAAWRPDRLLAQYRNRLEGWRIRIKGCMDGKQKEDKAMLRLLCARLEDLSPLKRIAGGFSYVALPSGKPLQSVAEVKNGESVWIHVRDGNVRAEVKETILTQDGKDVREET